MPKNRKYVFSYISFFDNVLTSKIITSDLDARNVVIQELEAKDWELGDDALSIEALKNLAFECDSMFEIVEV